MGLCCSSKNNKDGPVTGPSVYSAAQPEGTPKLSDITIYDVNTLLEDRWQYLEKKGNKKYADFDKMDRMVLSACNQYMEELLE